MSHLRSLIVASVLSTGLFTSLLHPQSPAEETLLTLANADRAHNHLPPLAWDPALAAAARTHALLLARHPGQLEHQLPGEPDLVTRAGATGARFSTVSENLAVANTSLASIEDGWMHSPTHRHNLLNPALDRLGIAVVPSRGLLYIVQDFSRSVPVLPLLTIERSVAHALLDHGLTLVSLSDTARLACRTPSGSQAPSPEDPARGIPSAVLQWDGPDVATDPTTLPPELLDELAPSRATTLGRSHPFRTALVGACPAQETAPGFSGYRIAVLLY